MEQELVACPYNPNHTLTTNRLPWHMLNCRSKVRSIQLRMKTKTVTCPFDSTHVIEIDFIQEHIEVACTSRPAEPFVPPNAERYDGRPRNKSANTHQKPKVKARPRKRSVDAVFVTEERKELR